MSKSPQYNQQTESKQRKSEVEEICIYTKTWKLESRLTIFRENPDIVNFKMT